MDRKQRVADSFKERSSLPNVQALLMGLISKGVSPKENKRDSFSTYQQYDTVCLGIVDGKTKFLDVIAGFPGSMHDSWFSGSTKHRNQQPD